MSNFESKIRPALKAEHPSMTQEEIDVFRRKWEVCFFLISVTGGRSSACILRVN